MDDRTAMVTLRPVDAGSWRDVAALTVEPGQERFVDAAHQGRGVGRAAVIEALRTLGTRAGSAGFALSYHPENLVARVSTRAWGSS